MSRKPSSLTPSQRKWIAFTGATILLVLLPLVLLWLVPSFEQYTLASPSGLILHVSAWLVLGLYAVLFSRIVQWGESLTKVELPRRELAIRRLALSAYAILSFEAILMPKSTTKNLVVFFAFALLLGFLYRVRRDKNLRTSGTQNGV